MKCWLVIVFLVIPCVTHAHVKDTNYIKYLYDRCLDFSEEKMDSIPFYANVIEAESKKLKFIKGDVLSLRLYGLYHELRSDYEIAIDFYLKSLEAARKINGVEYEIAALSDLSIVYSHLKRPEKAKEMYLESIRLSIGRGDIQNLLTAYVNLAAIYNQLNMQDSAMLFLKEALKVSKPFEDRIDLSSLYNNLGNVYFKMRRFDAALGYFNRNKAAHASKSYRAELWIDFLNIADVLIEKGQYDSARWYADSALQLAQLLHSRSKESDSYNLLSKLYSRRGDFQAAFWYQQKWYSIDTALVNSEINRSIASLQEKYNAREREHQNLLLNAAFEKEKQRSNTIALVAVATGIIAFLVVISLIQKRRANKKLRAVNELIRRQNERLAELNFEKNSLISIVSHDLSTPFASIKMWGNLLQEDNANLRDEQRKAIERIVTSTGNGETLIRTILDVEKFETNQRVAELEHFDLKRTVEAIVNDFRPAAEKKNIRLHYHYGPGVVYLLSDRLLVSRIFENLISNAIKFTPGNRNVWISVLENDIEVSIEVKDEGVGMNADDLNNLYSKYSKLSSRPTHGEASTGLGLFIVKRLVEELNGRIACESAPGNGSVFTVSFAK